MGFSHTSALATSCIQLSFPCSPRIHKHTVNFPSSLISHFALLFPFIPPLFHVQSFPPHNSSMSIYSPAVYDLYCILSISLTFCLLPCSLPLTFVHPLSTYKSLFPLNTYLFLLYFLSSLIFSSSLLLVFPLSLSSSLLLTPSSLLPFLLCLHPSPPYPSLVHGLLLVSLVVTPSTQQRSFTVIKIINHATRHLLPRTKTR